jgi:hypothetical protein
MSAKHPLDYESGHGADSQTLPSHRRLKATILVALGIVGVPFAISCAAMVADPEGGSVLPFALLFPYATLGALAADRQIVVSTLVIAQLPAYATAMAIGVWHRRFRLAVVILVLLHLGAAMFAIIWTQLQ